VAATPPSHLALQQPSPQPPRQRLQLLVQQHRQPGLMPLLSQRHLQPQQLLWRRPQRPQVQ
jgi:hypothetical protein